MRVAVLGAGRLGTALAAALAAADVDVAGPYSREQDPFVEIAYPDVVLLCVPDAEIAAAAAHFADDQMLAHCSGATGLDVLGPHPGFSLHPLTTVTAAGANFAGVAAAIDATSDDARRLAERLATALGMTPFELGGADRAAYHAAACIASNFLVTLEAAAERLAETTGLDRQLLVPLVRTTVENWAALGPDQALTGPVARGDRITVERQRAAVASRTPDLLPLFDALVTATGNLAGSTAGMPA
jgi:predicted short-subunit dehydrogenase-like oxidoreductase (DUF2520 family)